MGDLPLGSFNDCSFDYGTVIGHNMVMTNCFYLGELYWTYYVLHGFTSRSELCTSHAKCTSVTDVDLRAVLLIFIISALGFRHLK